MDKLKMEELPEPMGNFIIEQKDLYYLQLPDGRYWHYKDVVTMLSRLLKSRFNPSHSIGEETVSQIKELSLDERFNGHYHAGAAMMKEMILNLLNNKEGI